MVKPLATWTIMDNQVIVHVILSSGETLKLSKTEAMTLGAAILDAARVAPTR